MILIICNDKSEWVKVKDWPTVAGEPAKVPWEALLQSQRAYLILNSGILKCLKDKVPDEEVPNVEDIEVDAVIVTGVRIGGRDLVRYGIRAVGLRSDFYLGHNPDYYEDP